jgi:hypothetical protein
LLFNALTINAVDYHGILLATVQQSSNMLQIDLPDEVADRNTLDSM